MDDDKFYQEDVKFAFEIYFLLGLRSVEWRQ